MTSSGKTSDTILHKIFAARNRAASANQAGQALQPPDDSFGETKDLLHNIIESSLDGIVAVDRQGMWLFRPVRGGIWADYAEDLTLVESGGRRPPCPHPPIPRACDGNRNTV